VPVFLRALLIATMVMSAGLAHAQNPSEAPPREPPYVDDNEFDPVKGEDPSATSSQPIPVSPTDDPVPKAASPRRDRDSQYSPYSEAAPVAPKKESSSSYQKEYSQAIPAKREKGVQLLHHPDVKKGLIRIEQDGTYVYQTKTQKSNETGILRLGVMEPPNIKAADGVHNFADMYGGGMFTVIGEYEWKPFSKYGKLGVQAGVGFAMAEGNGYFVSDPSGERAEEKYTFFALPVNLGVVYRLEYFKRQWIAPYVSGGGSYIGVAELRDDNKSNFAGVPAGYGALGIMFNISAFDRSLAFDLSNEYNIANLWLMGEYRYQKAFTEDLDFTGGIMTLGIGADF
jgi:hypothetical protein